MRYTAPESFKDAEKVKLKRKNSRYLAGGTMLNWMGPPAASELIDLKKLPLYGIKKEGSGLSIGALTPISSLASGPAVPEGIKKAVSMFTSLNIKNMATAGGAVAAGFFVSNLLPAFMAYNSKAVYYMNGKKREIMLSNWLKDKKGILCFIKIKDLNRKIYLKQDKISSMDFPSVITAAGVRVKRSRIEDAVFVLSGVSGGTDTIKEAEEYLNSASPGKLDWEELDRAVQNNISPRGNVKVSARVKRRFIKSHIKSIVKDIRKELS